MKRVTSYVLVSLTVLMIGATAAQAQTPSSDEEGRFYAGIELGRTFGNKSNSAVGIEISGKVTDQFEVFIEGGRMNNVGSAELDTRANVVASFIKGTASATQKATFFDIGVKYRGPVIGGLPGRWRPYIGVGIGTAKVETLVAFTVNGTDVTSDLSGKYGIELGADLSDTLNKTFVVVPIGLQGTFKGRFGVDVSYRYGRISARPDDIDLDVAIAAPRFQVGFGVRF